jgi:hypothetical protein
VRPGAEGRQPRQDRIRLLIKACPALIEAYSA